MIIKKHYVNNSLQSAVTDEAKMGHSKGFLTEGTKQAKQK